MGILYIMIDQQVNIKDNNIFKISLEFLNTMLKDYTLSPAECQANIFLSSYNYTNRGAHNKYADQIIIDSITEDNDNVILLRAFNY